MSEEVGPAQPWYRNPWLYGILFGLVFIPLTRPLTRRVPPPPPVYSELPDFALLDARGRAVTKQDLLGDVWVVGFFFTSCTTICPRVLSALDELADKYGTYGHDVRVLAISVDPEVDTPERLQATVMHGRKHPERWQFLTGSKHAMTALVEGGFMLAMGDKTVSPTGLVDIAHTEKLALLDPRGRVRGFYSIDELGRDEVYHRSRHVLKEWNDAHRGAATPVVAAPQQFAAWVPPATPLASADCIDPLHGVPHGNVETGPMSDARSRGHSGLANPPVRALAGPLSL